MAIFAKMHTGMTIREKYASFRQKFLSFKEEHVVVRILLNKYVFATLLFVIVMCFIDNNNVGVWLRTRHRLRDQQKQIEYLQREISSTENRLDHLRSQKDSLEKFAREEYGFHEEGEDVYIVK